MKGVMKMFLTFTVMFWLVVLHWATFHLIDINGKVAIIMGTLLAHVDMFLIASFLVGYNNHQQKMTNITKTLEETR